MGLRLTTLRCRYTPVGVPTQRDQIGVVMKTIPPTACGSGTHFFHLRGTYLYIYGTLEAQTALTEAAAAL